jgi:hypothetical protein
MNNVKAIYRGKEFQVNGVNFLHGLVHVDGKGTPLPIADVVLVDIPNFKQLKKAFTMHKGEVCYTSVEDDQSYGMLCPVNNGFILGFEEGTEFFCLKELKGDV